ncbi:MAG: 3-keto-disaccharide hydrolase [Casimicrobium sp.]
MDTLIHSVSKLGVARWFATLAVGALLFGCASTSNQSGWTMLVDGAKGMENFTAIGDANWRAEDGAIVADKAKAASYLISKESYKDFQIQAEFWAETTTNSGIFIRLSNTKEVSASNSYEVNIYDQRPDPLYGTGAIVDFAKVAQPMPTAGGKWNTFLITAKGKRLTVEFNGKQTVDIEDGRFASGPIALQFGNGPKDAPGGAIKWRKVAIRSL